MEAVAGNSLYGLRTMSTEQDRKTELSSLNLKLI